MADHVVISGICEIHTVSGEHADPDKAANLFIELPHGATKIAELEAAKSLASQHDPRYDRYFLATTDQGSPEYGHLLAQILINPTSFPGLSQYLQPEQLKQAEELAKNLKIHILRAHLPRSIVDVNRVWHRGEHIIAEPGGLTAPVAPYIESDEDYERIWQAYDAYLQKVRSIYREVCDNGGYAFNLHTYAPISVSIVADEHIVDTIERAYQPENVGTYPVRPVVEFITAAPDEASLGNDALVALCQKNYAQLDIKAEINEPFPLHPASTTYQHAATHPGRILAMEVSRAALAETFNPFIEMTMDPKKVEKMTLPIAAATLEFLINEPNFCK